MDGQLEAARRALFKSVLREVAREFLPLQVNDMAEQTTMQTRGGPIPPRRLVGGGEVVYTRQRNCTGPLRFLFTDDSFNFALEDCGSHTGNACTVLVTQRVLQSNRI